jgi:hypothetical protein
MGAGLHAVACAIGKPIGAVLLGGVILWRVAAHVGPVTGTAVVHVSTAPVEVGVDDDVYRVPTLYLSPVVCELKPGRHTVRMMRDGRVLYREEIRILAGEDLVLAVWDQSADGRSPGHGG